MKKYSLENEIKNKKNPDGTYIHNKIVIYSPDLMSNKNFQYYKKIISAIICTFYNKKVITHKNYYHYAKYNECNNELKIEFFDDNYVDVDLYVFDLNKIYVDFKNNILYRFDTKQDLRKFKLQKIYEKI